MGAGPRRRPEAPLRQQSCAGALPPALPTLPRAPPAPWRSVTVRAGMPAGPQGNPQARASAVPGPEEDREVAHAAFMSAYGQPHHGPRNTGTQEFAGAVSAAAPGGRRKPWGRRRRAQQLVHAWQQRG